MRIQANIDNSTIEFTRNWFTGRATLVVDGTPTTLASPYALKTQINLSGQNRYVATVGGRELVIEHRMHFPFPAFRPMDFRLLLDGELLAEQSGF
ncbi:MAG: hypothetical protein CVT59_01035 [Actinobacteria bacterium HGW-Actinobacteria-1]|jgi:hypothetical protein|nr:MAG: hypothetical protein CVT59_01035 [Actinobacteria bacterium HGW-Actinobacteria-1]